MSYNELKQHGQPDFPFELYKINRQHPKYEMAFHWHASVELLRILSGSLTLTLNNCVLPCEAGDVLFINSEVIHGAHPEDCEYECLVFSLPFLKTGNRACDAFLDDLYHQELRVHRRLFGEAKDMAHRLFEAMDRETMGSAPFGVFAACYELFSAIQRSEQCIRDTASAEHKDERSILKLKKTLSFIRENFDEPITTDEMAAVAGLSTKYFCAFFKGMTGKTPVTYLTDYRIERAARKLLTSDASVLQIAYACGFNDLSYFIKTFKAHMGTTPRLYRKTVVSE